jgi:membrane protease YdiL (CAAX protease family)
MVLIFKESWKKRRANGLAIGFVFAILFAAVRGFGMLGPQAARPLIPLGFIIMMVLPYIFLTAVGRRQIGLRKSNARFSYVAAVLYGVGAASLCFLLGVLLFDNGPDNWFITIRNYYIGQVPRASDMPLQKFFIVVTIPALIFSPIGEELFFRGFLQDALQTRLGLQVSMVIESGSLGLYISFITD